MQPDTGTPENTNSCERNFNNAATSGHALQHYTNIQKFHVCCTIIYVN